MDNLLYHYTRKTAHNQEFSAKTVSGRADLSAFMKMSVRLVDIFHIYSRTTEKARGTARVQSRKRALYVTAVTERGVFSMKISGIICEYNPFHNGHLYHIEQTRRNGATHIVAVMSGNFVQRGHEMKRHWNPCCLP